MSMLNINSSKYLHCDNIVKILLLAASAYLSAVKIFQYHFYRYYDFDFAIFSQTMWSIIHGSMHTSILGMDFLGNHANFILFLIAPLYFIFRHPFTLLILQAFALSWAIYPIYLIAKKEIGERWGLFLVIFFLLYPSLSFINLFEFHPTPFAMFFLCYSFYFMYMNNFKLYMIFLILALLCQENIPLAVIPIGFYAFFLRKDWRWSVLPVILGISWFILTIKFIIPHFNNHTLQFLPIYRHLGDSLPDILTYILSHPISILKLIFSSERVDFLNDLFVSLFYLPLLDLRILMVFPLLLQHLLSLRPTEHTITYHYTAELIPFIYFSSLYGLKNILSVLKQIPYHRLKMAMIAVVIGFSLSNIFFYQGSIVLLYQNYLNRRGVESINNGFIRQIPSNARVVATFEFLPMLSQRQHLYSLHHIVTGTYSLSDRPYPTPENLQYALINLNDGLLVGSFYIPGVGENNLQKFFESNNWQIMDTINSTVLLKSGGSGKAPSLYQKISQFPPTMLPIDREINNELSLAGYRLTDLKNQKYHLTLYWKSLQKTHRFYENSLKILSSDKRVIYNLNLPICYRIYPTYSWEAGELIQEDFKIHIPKNIQKEDNWIFEITENVDWRANKYRDEELTRVRIPLHIKAD